MSQYAVDPMTVLMAWSAVGISAALTLWMAWRTLRGADSQRFFMRWPLAAMWAVPVAWAALDALHQWTETTAGTPDLIAQFGVLVAAALLALILAAEPRSAVVRGVRLVPALALTGLLAWQCFAFSHAIRSPLEAHRAEARFMKKLFPQGAIESAPADERYNCHDYVFHGGPRGKGELTNPQEELASRRYKQVIKPQLNDLIVYKDLGGLIMHTGIVRAVGANDFVIIESKWGGGGRYLHEPEVSGVSVSYTYWSNTHE